LTILNLPDLTYRSRQELFTSVLDISLINNVDVSHRTHLKMISWFQLQWAGSGFSRPVWAFLECLSNFSLFWKVILQCLVFLILL